MKNVIYDQASAKTTFLQYVLMFCISRLPCLLQLHCFVTFTEGCCYPYRVAEPTQDPVHHINLGAQRWECDRSYEASMIQATYPVQSLAFQLLRIVVNSCYIPSHLYFRMDKAGEDVKVLEFKSKKPKYSKIYLSLNKTQCVSVEKELICIIQKKSFVPITAYSEGITFPPHT